MYTIKITIRKASDLVSLLRSVKLYKRNIIVSVRVYQTEIHNSIYAHIYERKCE